MPSLAELLAVQLRAASQRTGGQAGYRVRPTQHSLPETTMMKHLWKWLRPSSGTEPDANAATRFSARVALQHEGAAAGDRAEQPDDRAEQELPGSRILDAPPPADTASVEGSSTPGRKVLADHEDLTADTDEPEYDPYLNARFDVVD